MIDLIRSGRLAYGRVNQDVLRELTLCEGCCQHNPGAADRFQEEYGAVINEAAREVGQRRAEEELADFFARLILPRGDRPPKLALFAGHTPLRFWIRQVVQNEWKTYLRGHRLMPLDEEVGRPGPGSSLELVVEEHECLEILQPLFEEAAASLSHDDSLLLRMVLLDGVPQNQVADLLGVHKSTVTHRKQAACVRLMTGIRHRASGIERREGALGCLAWLMDAGGDSRQVLGGILAGALRVPPP